MIAARKEESRSLLNLLIVGAVAAATIVVFFGVAFLWLGPLSPAMQPADPAPAAEALVTPEVEAPANNMMPDSSSAPPADNAAATATSGAGSDQEMLAMGSIAIATAITTGEDYPCKEGHGTSPSPRNNNRAQCACVMAT